MKTTCKAMMMIGLASSTSLLSATASAHNESGDGARFVYTETNAVAGNEVLVYRSDASGSLTLATRVATQGAGTDGGLGNQGALALAPSGKRLYAVNAGSNDITVFAVQGSGLTVLQKISSGGTQPVSLALHDDLLYALNAGGIGNITGYEVAGDGRLQPIAGSSRPLSAPAVGPAQVEFSNDGDVLVVTEKATRKIDLYDVADGVASGPNIRASNGATPFGFAFDKRGHLIVSEAFGGATGASALSSYDIDEATAPLELISGSVATGQTAACWVVVTRNGRYTYTSNTGSGTISGYRISHRGELSLLTAGGATGIVGAGSGPTDLALSPNSRLLFSLNPKVGTIKVFAVRNDGSLSAGSAVQDVPGSATGLVVR
jgi:6-phosphogluconolactonase